MKRIFRKTGYSQIAAMGIMVILVVLLYGIHYVDSVKSDLWGSSVRNIMESTSRAGNMIYKKLEAEESILARQKETLEALDYADADQIELVMQVFDTGEDSSALVLDNATYPQGANYVLPDIPEQISEDGELLAPYVSKNTGERVIALVYKVAFRSGETGTLIREIPTKTLSEAFSVTFLRNRGHSYLISRNGDILFRSTTARGNKTSGNLFTVLENEGENAKSAVDELAAIVSEGNSGWSVLSYNGESNLYYFSPVKSTDWYLVGVVHEDVLNTQTNHILLSTLILVCFILLGFAMLIGLLIYREHQNLKLLESENTCEKQMLIESNSEVKTIILGIDPRKDTYKVLSTAPDEKRLQSVAEARFSQLAAMIANDIDEEYQGEYKKRFSIEKFREIAQQQHKNEYYEFRARRNGAMHWIGAEAVAVHVANQDSMIVYSERIIDEAKKEEAENRQVLQNALDMAEQANHAKTTFLNSMSHDIRTPMNAIIGFTSLAMDRIDDREQVMDYLQKISTSGNHLLSLINDILDMSRIESGSMKMEEVQVHLPEVLQELKTIVQPDMDAKEMNFSIDTTGIADENVMCDKLHFNQIMLNLLSNAIKYTPVGGTISVEVIQKSAVTADYGCYECHVKDNGMGMSEEFQKHIFEPFSREQTRTISGIQGTGLGMAITRNIVKMLGGAISVASKPGQGTEFVVSLQFRICRELNRSTVPAKTSEEETEISLKGRKVLLAEDNELNREIVTAILEDAGIKVTSVKNGIEAVEAAAKAEPGEYDWILMDIQMPLMDGYTATREIRTLKDIRIADIPIIALTANAFDSDKQKALKTGMNGFVAKPVSPEKLLKMMRQLLARAGK